MNVTFVYRHLTLGGVEVVLQTRAQGLAARGIRSTFWFLEEGPGRSLFEGLAAQLRVGGLDELREYLQDGDADAVSIIDTPEALSCIPKYPRTPRVLLEVHTAYPENRVYLRSKECRVAWATVVPSHHQAQVVQREMLSPPVTLVVANPLSPGFEQPPRDVRSLHIPPAVGWIGRLDRLKNWRGFLEIARELAQSTQAAEFWVVGTGAADEELAFERMCRQDPLLGRVRWWRGMSHNKIPRLLDQIRSSNGVVVSTTRGESFGMAIAEAMARACAVVVPRVGAFPEFITDGEDGCLYPPEEWSRAADLVLRLLENGYERAHMGAAARERILSTHRYDIAVSALADALWAIPGIDRRDAPPAARSASARPIGEFGKQGLSGARPREDRGGIPPGPSPDEGGDARAQRRGLFAGYYASGFWPGPGSSLDYTAGIRRELPVLLRRLDVKVILDAPCGDSEWFSQMERESVLLYIGGDIVPELLVANQRRFGSPITRFEVIDITSDPLPSADLWLCRDCLFHFSDRMIHSTIRNYLRSGIRYILTTTHPECRENSDIQTGGFRLLNLELPPFNFPAPIVRIDDWIEGYPIRQLALWERETLRDALETAQPPQCFG